MEHSNSTILSDLPSKTCWGDESGIVKLEGFWYPRRFLGGILAAKSHFQVRDGDVILASPSKTGSTWLKAIIPCIMNHSHDQDYDPFVLTHPNSLIPSFEFHIFIKNSNPDLLGMPSPRLFRTQAPYEMLSESIKNSTGCKIIYITREPKDVFVPLWHFMKWKLTPDKQEQLSLSEAFDSFCDGIYPFGPFHDHVLSYWTESLKCPEKFHFMRYEDLKTDQIKTVQRLASFLGRSLKEEEAEEVMRKCDLNRLKNLEVNKNGLDPQTGFSYNAYFGRGVVGDWKNYLSVEMKERLDKITQHKFNGSGLI